MSQGNVQHEIPNKVAGSHRSHISVFAVALVWLMSAAVAVLVVFPSSLSGASETIVVAAARGTGSRSCQLFHKPMDRQNVPWTTGTIVEEWDAVVYLDLESRVLVERGYTPDAARESPNRSFFLRWRALGEKNTTPLLSLEQLEAALSTSMTANPHGHRNDLLASHVQMSPDKQWLAFDYWRRGTRGQDIWAFSVGRRSFTRITQGEWFDEMPVWSPDSTRLAFYRSASGVGHGEGSADTTQSGYALWVWDRRSGLAREIAPPGQYAGYEHRPPAWSPDGSVILFQRASDQSKEPLGLCLVGAGGGQIRVLTEDTKQSGGPAINYSFSPDGNTILYTWPLNLYAVRPDGTARRALLPGRFIDFAKWNCDGTWIIVGARTPSGLEWLLARPDGLATQPIAPPPGYRIVDVFTYME